MKQDYKLLIIEDSDAFQKIISRVLEDEYELMSLHEATNAIEFCKQYKPDLILLDIMLGGDMNGLAFLNSIKNTKVLSHIPVILISALATHDIITEGLKLGANDFLVKPFDLNQMLYKIRNLLSLASMSKQKGIIEQNIPFEIGISRQSEIIENLNRVVEHAISINADISIIDIAKELHISQSTLTRLVRNHFGTTTNNYVMRRKLEKAKIIIHSDKGLAIKEVAFSLGFGSVSYFSKCYRHYFGEMPSSSKK